LVIDGATPFQGRVAGDGDGLDVERPRRVIRFSVALSCNPRLPVVVEKSTQQPTGCVLWMAMLANGCTLVLALVLAVSTSDRPRGVVLARGASRHRPKRSASCSHARACKLALAEGCTALGQLISQP